MGAKAQHVNVMHAHRIAACLFVSFTAVSVPHAAS